MSSVETESRRIKKARNKSGKVVVLAVIWLIIIENIASYFQLGRFFVITTVLPLVIYWAYTTFLWRFASCPICNKRMFLKFIFSVSIFNCVHCGYDLTNRSSSTFRE